MKLISVETGPVSVAIQLDSYRKASIRKGDRCAIWKHPDRNLDSIMGIQSDGHAHELEHRWSSAGGLFEMRGDNLL